VVYNHIRGLIPWPVGYGVIEGRKIKFHKVDVHYGDIKGKPGEVLGLIDASLAIQAQDGIIFVNELQLEGKGKTNAIDFFNGFGKHLVALCFSDHYES
jgi:methionyl-tRNA formyltransferase